MTNEGSVSAEFGGSFNPGKSFTLTAYVLGPLDGQNLTLLLPKGIELVSGKSTQIVPSGHGCRPKCGDVAVPGAPGWHVSAYHSLQQWCHANVDGHRFAAGLMAK